MTLNNLRDYAPILLRYALSFVFLWFGFNQLFNTANFLGYLPDFLFSNNYASTIIIANGVFEIILGILLLLGLFIRPVAFLLGLHFVGIIAGLGYGDVAVRDFGLMLATFAIMLWGEDKWSLSIHLKKK